MVITLDKRKRPLSYCTEKRARQLIEKGRACVYRYYPFTIIIKDKDSRKLNTIKEAHRTYYEEQGPASQRYKIRIDPGAVHTGIAVLHGNKVILFMQIEHKGGNVVAGMFTRHNARHNRRHRETWYRHCKFGHRGKYETPRPKGWLPPSQRSIADNVINWVIRLERLLGPCDVDIEGVKFDTQLMDNPEIEGIEYQQGTLLGYEMRHYLLDKYQHTCQYCIGESGDSILEWEHMMPKSRGGSDSVKNATLSCRKCNSLKKNMTPAEWFEKLQRKKKPSELDKTRIECLENVIAGRKNGQNQRYAAWVTTTRDYLYYGIRNLPMTGNVHRYTGGRTAYNRARLDIGKDHHLDALCVGYVPEAGFRNTEQKVLYVKATGRGKRLLGQINACGVIIVKYRNKKKAIHGFRLGDIVKADVPKGKYKGSWTGKVYPRGSKDDFAVKPFGQKQFDTNYANLRIAQRSSGYEFKYV